MAATPAQANATVWQALYAGGSGDLRYPSEVLVRLAARLLPPQPRLRVLDYGCGTGANLVHLAGLGHDVHGVDVAPAAVEAARKRLAQAGVQAQVQAVAAAARLPFDTGSFDAVVAWQVLCYNDPAGWTAAVADLERVARAGARIIVATAAPGDVSQVRAQPLGGSTYRSQVPGQEGCVLTIPTREELAPLFPGRQLEVGEFAYTLGDTQARHWIVTYRTPQP